MNDPRALPLLVLVLFAAIPGCSYQPHPGPAGVPLSIGLRNAAAEPVRVVVDASTPWGPVHQPTMELLPGAAVRLEYEKSAEGPVSGFATTERVPVGHWVDLVSKGDNRASVRWFVLNVDRDGTATISPDERPLPTKP
jgi:hypothetical protein